LLLFGVLASAGCTDSVDSVCREYRAAINESIDALAMITTEAHAARMKIRVFAPMGKRFEDIGKRMDNVKSNRDKNEMATEMLTSDGLQIYITDLQVNRQRYGLEIVRLRNLYKQYMERERELLVNEGMNDPAIDGKAVCPVLHDLLYEGALETLRSHLVKSPILGMMSQMQTWKKVKDYPGLYLKFSERRKIFAPKRDIKLVN
ncbi:MAG: hypothetical protein HYR84_02400, partial [Planctomycetes bacterium]|nr:hypothetical protein [Planctomycetota bacterium]